MKIWWFWRFSMETFVVAGASVYFIGGKGGYMGNIRGRYVTHRQKRERSFFRNPYFVPLSERKLTYDKNFKVVKKDNKQLIEN
mmetsp:Transcript_33334/g.34640  ORF Transcript_33334/g.34640 Transcript_33334/m.34640 type:complete len:83 (+) Transcript_33334:44-292(+)